MIPSSLQQEWLWRDEELRAAYWQRRPMDEHSISWLVSKGTDAFAIAVSSRPADDLMASRRSAPSALRREHLPRSRYGERPRQNGAEAT
jgi:hypothetical protein